MKVVVCGANGCIGSAISLALRAQGHSVIEGVRDVAKASNDARVLEVNFSHTLTPAQWAARLRGVDAVINAVGILMESHGQRFAAIHSAGPRALFAGAQLAGVKRVLQISALGIDKSATAYAQSKLQADDALAQSELAYTVLRPSLVYGPRSQSLKVFTQMSRLPLIALPSKGDQALQPLHSYELADIACKLLAAPASRSVVEVGGNQVLSYREILETLRRVQGLRPALYLPVPMWFMRSIAAVAERLPQQVLSRDGLGMLEQGCVTSQNAAEHWLGRAPTLFAEGAAMELAKPADADDKKRLLGISTHLHAIHYEANIDAAGATHGSALRARS